MRRVQLAPAALDTAPSGSGAAVRRAGNSSKWCAACGFSWVFRLPSELQSLVPL